MKLVELEVLPSNNTIGPVNARTLQVVRMNHEEQRSNDRPGRFLKQRAAVGQHLKLFNQAGAPLAHAREESAYQLFSCSKRFENCEKGLLTMNKRNEITDGLYARLRSIGSQSVRLDGLAKVHRKGYTATTGPLSTR